MRERVRYTLRRPRRARALLPGADLAHHHPSCHGGRPLARGRSPRKRMAMSLTASGVEAAMEATAVPRVMPLAESRRR